MAGSSIASFPAYERDSFEGGMWPGYEVRSSTELASSPGHTPPRKSDAIVGVSGLGTRLLQSSLFVYNYSHNCASLSLKIKMPPSPVPSVACPCSYQAAIGKKRE